MHVPRTASVTALVPTTLASCDKETFDEYVRPLFADDDLAPSGVQPRTASADGESGTAQCLPHAEFPSTEATSALTAGRAPALACRFRPAPGRGRSGSRSSGLHGAVHSLTHPARDQLDRAEAASTTTAARSRPSTRWGHDHLWWLDRMVRTNRPLVERMTLVWHDWFATSNDGVGSQRLMLQPEPALPQRTASARSPTLLLEVTSDPAMLLWLLGHRQREGRAERELRARADGALHARRGRGYTERDVREQARALTGWRNDWNDDKRPGQLPLRPASATTPAPRRSSASAAHFDWQRLRAGSAVHHPKHASFFVAKLWSYFVPIAARRGDAARARDALRAQRLRDPPGRRGDPPAPALYNGPRMVKPPAVYIAGLLRALGRGIDTEAWTWLLEPGRPAALLPAERRGLGRRRAGSTRRPSAPAGSSPATRSRPYALTATRTRRPLNADEAARPRRSRAGATRRLTPPTTRGAEVVRHTARSPTPTGKWKKRAVPAADRERAPPADRRLPPTCRRQLMDNSCHHCNEFSRADAPAPGASPQAGAGCPTIEAGMPPPPAPGSTAAASSRAPLGLALAVYGATALTPRRSTTASRRRSPPALAARCSSPSSSTAAPTRSRCSTRHGDPNYRRLRPDARARQTRASSFPEDTRLRWHPSCGRLATRCTARARWRCCRPSATRTPTSRTSPRATTGRSGATDRAAPDRLAGPLPRPRRHGRQPAPGPVASTDRAAAVARVDEECPSPSLERPERLLVLARRASGARSRTGMLDDARRARRTPPARRCAQRRRATVDHASRDRLRRQLAPFAQNSGNGFGSPVQYPESTAASRASWPASRRCSPRDCRSAASRSRAPGGYDTHSDQRAGARRRARHRDRTTLLAFQRDLEARGARRTAC